MRLIDADALIDRLDYCVKEGMGSTIAFTFKHMVEEAPTIDIPHGDDWERYSERLWKRAYERGKADRPQGWIPCSERLPKWNTRVLFYLEKECYYDYPEPQYVTDWWIQEGSFNDKYGAFVYDSPDIGKGIPKDRVVAWMPLPKPWKGADDE